MPLDTQGGNGLLVPGRNCWRIEFAHRVSFLVDGAAYFRAVRRAIAAAQRSIFILAWDIDSRIPLVPEGAKDGFPEPLGDFLNAVVSRRRGLQAYVLNWDFAMVYAMDREWMPFYKLDFRTHRRMHFHMDSRHPIGAAHHQKVVVIDDEIAFVGGLDLTHHRWDTSEHPCTSPLRQDVDGAPYPPFHDVQALVDGPAAQALGELARERWRRATGRALMARPAGRAPRGDPWPQEVTPDLTDVEVGIARTEPRFEDVPGATEIRHLYADAIASAREAIYCENQYFTSAMIGTALAQRLAEPDGPDTVIVSRRMESGWLEEATMGVLRARLHRRMKEVDVHGRYRMYIPNIPGLEGECLNVHSKVMVIDDELLSVGSANLNNRSMVLDTECNLVIEAHGEPRVRQAIARFRNRLLAEHLALTPEAVEQAHARHGRLIATIEALMRPGRSLYLHDPQSSPEIEALLPEQVFIDPERPIDPDQLVAQFVPKDAGRPMAGKLIGLGAVALVLGLLAITWRWTPLREYMNIASLSQIAEYLKSLPYTPLAVIAAYIVASLVLLPVTLLNATTAAVFGPGTGWVYALSGSLVSAAVTYGLGAWAGRDTVRRFAGRRLNRLSRRIAKRGVSAMVVVRLLPIAPFTVVNVVAGASHIRLRDFMLGSFFGMVPGITATVTFIHQLTEAVRNPSIGTFALLAAVAGVLIGLAFAVRRYLTRRENLASAAVQQT